MTARYLLPVLLSLCSFHACAQFSVSAGVARDIDDVGTQVATFAYLSRHEHPWEFTAGHLFERNDPRYHTASTTFVAASRRLTWRRWFVSGGVALTDADNEVLSGPLQFYTGAGYAGEHWTLSLRHLSNADIRGRNRGETFVLLGYGW